MSAGRLTPRVGFNTGHTQISTVLGSDPLEELSIPDGTHVREHDLVTDGDVLVGGQSVVELGVRGGNVVAGERVQFGGDIEADGDCRLDMWCEVEGNVLVGEDAYLGERAHITGQLIVSGDLDIGDDVDIERGFEANGWIVIRNPMPTIVFLFVYLSHLLRIGEEEAAEAVASEFLGGDEASDPVVIPRGARVSDDAWRVSEPATLGDNCRVHGNIRATEITVGADTELFGSLRAKGDIHVGAGTEIHGDVTTKGGDVFVDSAAQIRGDISCEACELSETAVIDGAVRASEATNFRPAPDDGRDPRDGDAARDGTPGSEDGDAARDGTPGSEDGDAAPDDGRGSENGNTQRDGAGEGKEPPDPDVEPAVVPLGEGTLPVARTPAVVSAEHSDFDWGDVEDRSKNGSTTEVETIIADAEE
jgi:predicted acyltransferase (DUF342 family)